MHILIDLTLIYLHMYVHVCNMYARPCVDVRGQPAEVGSLLVQVPGTELRLLDLTTSTFTQWALSLILE